MGDRFLERLRTVRLPSLNIPCAFHVPVRSRIATKVHICTSGDPTPSADDRTITRQLVDAGRLLDIPVYDHLVLGAERYLSFAEAGLL